MPLQKKHIMTYEESYFKTVRAKLKSVLPENRYIHSLGTEEKSRELALKFDANANKAAMAGLLHDCAKFIKKEDMYDFILQREIPIIDDTINSPSTLHSYASEYLASHEYGIDDPEILSAIRNHTLGDIRMTVLDKIVFIADKIEDRTRHYDFANRIRTVLEETNDLNSAILVSYAETIKGLIDKHYYINQTTIRNWNYLLEETGNIKPIIKDIGLYQKVYSSNQGR